MNRFEKLDQWLLTSKCNGILVTKPENIGYLTGFWGSFGAYLQTPKGRFLVTDGRYREIATALAKKEGFEFLLFAGEVPTILTDAISGALWVEDTLTISDFKRYRRWFKNAKLKAQSGAIESLRSIKTEPELDIMRAAQAHVDEILLPFLKTNLKLGVSEAQLKFKLDQTLRERGKFGLSFESIVGFGAGSALPHYESGDRKLKQGDNILIDCGVIDRYYCSDMTRNFCYGLPSGGYKKDYAMLLQAQKSTLNQVKAGVKAQFLDSFCREAMGKESELFVHSLGHGVGLEIHEAPTLSAKSKDVLQVHEVVTVEPGIYRPNQHGIRIEDSMIVLKDGCEVLTKTTKELLSFDEEGRVQVLLG